MINIKEMMQQAQQMQFKMQEMQEKMKDVTVTGEAGGGMVTVTMSCVGQIKGIEIDPAVIVPDDKETLEDLIAAAVNNATDAKEQRVADETKKMMEALGLPPDAQMPF